ncbi:MAG: response regulator transcription factor [Bacteroidota bacterium]
MQKDIHIALVEDDPELRQLMQLILDRSPGFRCSLHFEDAETAIPEIIRYQPDVVLMDIGLPGISGIEAVQTLQESIPDIPILMLTVQVEQEMIFKSLYAGASGYLLKSTAPVEILEAIKEATMGGAPMSREIARKVIQSFHRPQQQLSLSARELEVLKHLCDGETYTSIAELLFLSPHTVKVHIKNIYDKMHVHSRAEAVKKAIKEGLI